MMAGVVGEAGIGKTSLVEEVLAEIEMMTNLIIATSESDGPLPQVKIDEILGVDDDMPPV